MILFYYILAWLRMVSHDMTPLILKGTLLYTVMLLSDESERILGWLWRDYVIWCLFRSQQGWWIEWRRERQCYRIQTGPWCKDQMVSWIQCEDVAQPMPHAHTSMRTERERAMCRLKLPSETRSVRCTEHNPTLKILNTLTEHTLILLVEKMSTS